MKSILVFGATGQVGQGLATALRNRKAIFLSRDEADFADPDQLQTVLDEQVVPRAIINAAAYTAVDKAEEEAALATTINALSPRILARYAKEHNVPLLHYSTDYVFDGSDDQPRDENAATSPLNHYGKSKRAGEEAIMESGCDYLIFRTAWVYDAVAKNFFTTMARLMQSQETLRIVDDQIGAPTYAPQLAEVSIKALDIAMKEETFPSGIYHLTHAGEVSWYGFAQAIAEGLRGKGCKLKLQELQPIPSSDYPTPAKRPLNSRLDNSKCAQIFGVSLPDWQEGLKHCLNEYNA